VKKSVYGKGSGTILGTGFFSAGKGACPSPEKWSQTPKFSLPHLFLSQFITIALISKNEPLAIHTAPVIHLPFLK
jgi:hypothetical protein